jgi:tetratricopeptide (TPR) repeat protein
VAGRERREPAHPEGNNQAVADLALSMIVRNEAATLRRCLASVRGVAQEMVVADTGSTDATPEIAREFGAQVIAIPWEDDFAAARNRALEPVRSGWVLSLDADEMLDPAAGAEIAALTSAGRWAAWQVTIRNYLLRLEERIWDRPAQPNRSSLPEARTFPAFVDHENVRLFRRDPQIYFVGRVHESVGPRVEALRLPLGRASFLIHHFGLAADQETRAGKNRFYRELGRQKVLDLPDSAQAQLELGLVELDNFNNLSEALACFERACALNPRLGVAWFFAGVAQLRQGTPRAALRSLGRAERCGHATPFVAEMRGDAHYNLADFPAAVRAYRAALARAPESAELRSKLGLALVRAGAGEEGLRLAHEALERQPESGELHDRFIQMLVFLERREEAAQAAENKLRTVPGTAPGDFLRAAGLWAGQGDWARATAMLHVGRQLYREDSALNQALADLSSREGGGVNRLVTALEKGVVPGFQD